MANTIISHLTLTGLQTYDALIKAFIEDKVGSGIANSFKFVDLKDGKLNFYTVNPITNDTVPAYSIALPEQDLSHLMELVANATAGNVAVFGENGQVVDTGIKAADLAMKSEVEAVDAKADTNAEAIEALDKKIGTIPATATATDIVGYVQEKTAGIATSENLAELTERVAQAETDIDNIEKDYLKAADKEELAADIKANADAIDVLNGEGEGSVKKAVDEAINKFATDVTNDDVVNSYKELIDWAVEHGSDAAEMAAAIEQNALDIEALEKFVGALPEGETSADIVAFIQKLVNAEVTAREALDARVVVVEGKAHTHANAEVLDGITAEKVAAWDAAKAEAIADAETKNAALETALKNADAEMLAAAKEYADSKVEGVDLSGIATNAADIDKLEAALAEGGATATAIASAQAKADQAQNEVDALELVHAADKKALEDKDAEIAGNVTAVSDRVAELEGIKHEEITTEQINALFA